MSLLVMLFSICTYRMAELEKRRGWLWASINVGLSLFLSVLSVSSYFSAVGGLMLSFAAMTAANVYRPIKKGPFLT